MRARIISGLIMAGGALAAVLCGGWLFALVLAFLALYASYEAVRVISKEFYVPAYVCMVLTIASYILLPERIVVILIAYAVLLLGFSVFDEKLPLPDACYLYLIGTLLAFAMSLAYRIETQNPFIVIYVVLASCITDMGALFAGMKFGKHKLNPRVSPKKTVEGAIGGWILGGLVSYLFAYFTGFMGYEPVFILIASVLLPPFSELGDLAFSLVKRHYGVKDFSSLIPGHGGVLDRIDSVIFCLVLFCSMVSFL